MYSHVTLGSNDLDRGIAFYDAVLRPLGLVRAQGDAQQGFAGYAPAGATTCAFWLLRPLDGQVAHPGNGTTTAFDATDRATVDAFHAAALAAGGRDEGAPGLRLHYHPHYYGAYVRDPDGHKLCCVCHRPA